jgi:large subunit ribosomal protein L9
MKVVLLKDVDKLGKAGEVVEVASGYANNFLFRRDLAVELTPENLNTLKNQQKAAAEKAQRLLEEAGEIKNKIADQHFTLKVKTGSQGKLYGSVTTMDIAAVLEKAGYKVDKRNISVEEQIKEIGEYKVEVKLHPEVNASIVVDVVSEGA